MTFEEITERRKALFATGTMRLDERAHQMVATKAEFQPLADLYNHLAASHRLAKRGEQ